MRGYVLLLAGGALAVAGCHGKPERTGLDALDNELVNGTVTAESKDAKALREAIRVKRVAPAPATATATAGKPADGACLSRYGGQLASGPAWAGKLPPELAAAPRALVTDAAGHDGGCAIRIVSYSVPGDAEAVLGWYAGKARHGGYSADRGDTGGDRILAGTKGAAAYYIMAGAATGGTTPVDVVWAATG